VGLISSLDFHKSLRSGKAGESVEVEYQLYSWGEIYPPFHGNREHSIDARYILRDFPFKLFSSSTPYDDPLPQNLCLTFKAPDEVKKDTKNCHISGIFPHEIAKEFAAFLSLVTRRRVFVERQTRYDGLPIVQEVEQYQRPYSQERQRLKEIDPNQIYQLLENLQTMDRRISNGFILAMRLYHAAVEMMYTEPEFSYLFLVTCLEAISSVVYEDYRPNSEEEFLDSRTPEWRSLFNILLPEQRQELKGVLLRNEKFIFYKLSKFINENVPKRFWSETEDDAKPDYFHSNITIQDWEKIEKGRLKKVLRNIYTDRSKLIHEGIRLPASIVVGLFRGIPIEAISEIRKNQGRILTID
jgi:hypothetical protein